MNTMIRNTSAPQTTSLAASPLVAGGRPAAAGIHRGIWIGGGLMALTIVALATALVVKSNGPDTAAPVAAMAPAAAVPGTSDAPAAPPAPAGIQNESTANPPIVNSSVAQAPDVVPAPAPARTVHHHRPVRSTTPANTTVATAAPAGDTASPDFDTPPRTGTGIAPAACTSCGVVDSYDAVQVQGQANGVGAVAGGVGGALLGSQIAGRGNHTLGGLIGAVGGGLLGNTIEKHQRSTTVYDVHVRMSDGSTRTVRQSTLPSVGERVRIEGNVLHAAQ